MKRKTAIIIGAGPAGLTAAYELLQKTDIRPVILEQTDHIGGISSTFNHHGNRMDMGGHRFFSKSDRVMKWWQEILPLQGFPSQDDILLGRDKPLSKAEGAPDPERSDKVMLLRDRFSRIYYLRKFFDYPVKINATTLNNLGVIRIFRSGLSYLKARAFPIRNEKSLEDFMINRFGRDLYNTFFRDYTEKVWGVPPTQIQPDWGAQRIKGISISKIIAQALRSAFRGKERSLSQKETETSLIEQFIYPKFGPGQLWEEVADRITAKGGDIRLHSKVSAMEYGENRITAVEATDTETGAKTTIPADYFFSSMPVRELIRAAGDAAARNVREVAEGLVYRDFMTVGLLVKKLAIRNTSKIRTVAGIVPDLWIYIQEADVRFGRLQIFNNWSPYMVRDLEHTVWLGLEYFCNEGDDLWTMEDGAFMEMAAGELAKIGIISPDDVLDSCLVRVPKAYPAYFGTYKRFDEIRRFTDRHENLFLIGRNGQHRYNNMDHSMLTAMTAVDNIIAGITTKDNIWDVNTDEAYHEKQS